MTDHAMHWDYRVVLFEDGSAGIYEVCFTDIDGVIALQGRSEQPAGVIWDEGGSPETTLRRFQRALGQPALRAEDFEDEQS